MSLSISAESLPSRPAVKLYLEKLRVAAEDLSNISPLEYYDHAAQSVENVYVSISSLSSRQARELLEQQQEDVRKHAQQSHTAQADKPGGTQLHNLEVLLQRENDAKQIRRALVLGWAGSGKSVISFKILHDWLEQKTDGGFRHYLAVIYISGRDASRVSTTSRRTLLGLEGFDEKESEVVVEFLSKNSDRVLYIVDGADEVAQGDLLKDGTVLKDLLLSQGMFSNSSLILTSRPCSALFKVMVGQPFQRMFSLIGFREKQLGDLAQRYLKAGAKEFMEQLSSPDKAQVKAAVQETPLFAAMIIRLFAKDGSIPTSITKLYEGMLQAIILGNAQRLHSIEERRRMYLLHKAISLKEAPESVLESAPSSAEELAKQLSEAASELAAVALKGLSRQCLTFKKREVTFDHLPGVDVTNTGILTTMKTPGPHTNQAVYTFHHLSWQEFLAAKKLAGAKNFPEELTLALKESNIGLDQHTWLFWRFVAGMIPSSMLPEFIAQLAVALEAYGSSRSAKRRRFFLMACLMEQDHSHFDSFLQLAISCLFPQKKIDASNCFARPHELSALAFALKNAGGECTLKLENSGLSVENLQTLALPQCNIRDINLSRTALSGSRLAQLASGSRSMPHLESLNVVDCKLSDNEAPSIGDLVFNCKSLKKLLLRSNLLRAKGMLRIAQCIPVGSSLEELQVSFNDLSNLDGVEAGKALSKAYRLHTFHAIDCGLMDSAVTGLLPHFQSLLALKTVTMKQNKLTGSVLPAVADLFRIRHESQSKGVAAFWSYLCIEMAGNRISEAEVEHFAKELIPFGTNDVLGIGLLWTRSGDIWKRKLEDYWLVSGNVATCPCHDLQDAHALAVADTLKKSTTNLHGLELQMNSIADKGATAIASSVSVSGSLRGMDLSSNLTTYIGAEAFGRALSRDRCTLVYLNLSYNPIFSEDLASARCFEALAGRSSCLKILALSKTGLADCSLEALSSTSQLAPNLHLLDLSKNFIGDVGAKCLAQKLTSNETLELLSLSGNRITEDGALALDAAVSSKQSKSQLECVWLGDKDLPEEFFKTCRSDCFLGTSFSLVRIKVEDVLSTYLPKDTPDKPNEKTYQQNQCALGFFSRIDTLEDTVNMCLSSSDASGLFSLMLRSLQSSFLDQNGEETKEIVRKSKALVRLLSRCLKNASAASMKCTMLAFQLCVANVLSLRGHLPGLAVENILYQLGRMNLELPDHPVAAILNDLAKTCRDLPDIGIKPCFDEQSEFIRNSFPLLCGKWVA